MPQHEFKLTPEILAWLSKPLFSLSADGQVLAHGRPLPDRRTHKPWLDPEKERAGMDAALSAAMMPIASVPRTRNRRSLAARFLARAAALLWDAAWRIDARPTAEIDLGPSPARRARPIGRVEEERAHSSTRDRS